MDGGVGTPGGDAGCTAPLPMAPLNAFFNDETDPSLPLNVDGDYFRPDRLKKQRIRVSLKFPLGNTPRACRLSFTAAIGLLLANGYDRVRTHNQRCEPCIFLWNARNTR
jgi:hypothetical protein